jgi:fluoroquinolone transport system permease protein
VTTPAPPAHARAVRVRHLAVVEARVQWRYGIVALVAVVTLAWTAVLAALPTAVARVAAPWVLILDTAVLGTTLVGALVILERDRGMRAAAEVSPARVGERVAAKVGTLAALVVAASVPITLAGRPVSAGGALTTVAGVGLVAVLTMLVAVAVAARCQSLITFITVLSLVLLPLLAPALAHGAGLGHRILYAVPTVGGMDLIAAGYGTPGVAPVGSPGAPPVWATAGWLALACAGAGWWARHRFRPSAAVRAYACAEQRHSTTTSPVARAPVTPAPGRRQATRVRAMLSHDLVRLRRDPLLLVIGLSPLVLGLALRSGYPSVHAWLAGAYGFDLDSYRPLLLGLAVVLHVPFPFGMVGALMVLDDVDSRALMVLRVSPLTLPRFLGYRAALVTTATGLGLAITVPLSGLVPGGQLGAVVPALAAAVLLAPLTMLAALAVAGNKVEGVAVLKLLGLPLYAPVAAWWLDGAAGWLLAVTPSWWVLRSLWEAPGIVFAAGGVVLSAGALALLGRRALSRLGGPAGGQRRR